MVAAMQWMLKRPWTIMAETPANPEKPGVHWERTTHGMMAAWQDTLQVIRNLEKDSTPDERTGPLQVT
jgi:hypothetical protein